MAEQQYYVIGGEYADTNFTVPAPGTELETHGPFSEREAKLKWRELTGKTVDNAMVRYFIKASEQSNSKIYWVVGGEYADTSFTKLAPGKELEVYGPFEKWEALGFWRGLTSKSVDDALVRYDIRENYDQESTDGGVRRLGGSAQRKAPVSVKSVTLPVPAEDAFAFLMDAGNWPRWAVHTITDVRPGAGGYWEIDTPSGSGHFKLEGNAASGDIDTTYKDGDKYGWTVPGRVVQSGEGSTVVMIYTKPPTMSEQDYDKRMKNADEELSALKRVLAEG